MHPKKHLLANYTELVDLEDDCFVELVFLGTGRKLSNNYISIYYKSSFFIGNSTCLPNIRCLSRGSGEFCKVCQSAFSVQDSKNKRRTTSISVRFKARNHNVKSSEKAEDDKLVVIDCGKSFYDSVLDWLLLYNDDLPKLSLEALLITHGHADAILGLDDLRHFTSHQILQSEIPIYCDKETFSTIKSTFPYLVDTKRATGIS